MKKEAVISVKGTQSFGELEAENTQITTVGSFYKRGKFYYLAYDESEITGLPDTKTVIRAADKSVKVTRVGKYPSSMSFELGERNVFMYNTVYGVMSMAIETERVEVALDDSGGSVAVDYTLTIERDIVGHNRLRITVATQPTV